MKPEELERQYQPGQVILERGAECRELFVIRQGQVILDRGGDSDVTLIGSGQIFGELGSVLGVPSPYRASADEDVQLLVLDSGMLNTLCSESADFAVRLAQHLAEVLHSRESDSSALAGAGRALSEGYRKLVPVLFESASGDETPTPSAMPSSRGVTPPPGPATGEVWGSSG